MIRGLRDLVANYAQCRRQRPKRRLIADGRSCQQTLLKIRAYHDSVTRCGGRKTLMIDEEKDGGADRGLLETATDPRLYDGSGKPVHSRRLRAEKTPGGGRGSSTRPERRERVGSRSEGLFRPIGHSRE